MLQSKAPHFFTMKKAFPHGCLGISKDGHAIFAMKMGVLQENYSQIEEAGLSNDEVVKHLALVYEYFFEEIDPDPLPGGQLINLMDFEGMGIMDMKGATHACVACTPLAHSGCSACRMCRAT